MILRLLFLFNIFLNFDFAYLFPDDSDIHEYYRKNVVYKNRNTEHSIICDIDITLWGAICKNVIQRLRKDFNGRYWNLYSNYRAFNKGSRCQQRKVRYRLLQNSEITMQNSLPCYACFQIIPCGMPNQYHEYYNEVIIFPYKTQDMMIFARNQNTDDYTLLTSYNNFKWKTFKPLSTTLFGIPVPCVYNNDDIPYPELRLKYYDLYDISKNNIHIIDPRNYILFRTCSTILKSKYGNQISTMRNVQKCRRVALNIPSDSSFAAELQCTIYACPCVGYHNTRSNEKTEIKYIVAVVSDSSVVLLENMEIVTENVQLPVYSIVHYYENMSFDYLENFHLY